ncbi:ABC transporter permease [Pseudonocardiaceae bacterium YIM PH 21723]|nr:ABC transporter permease [Pseudonocardiaceae bacterium YIM PH 21723]
MTEMLTGRKERIDRLAGDASVGRSLWSEAFRRMRRSPVAITGAVLVAAFLLLAAFAPLIAPHSATERFPQLLQDLRADHIPGAQPGFPLGSDQLGHDLFSRLLLASQQTLLVAVAATVFGMAVGMLIGGTAGALGGWVDNVLMRLVDVLLSFPSLLLAISIAALFSQGSQWTVIIAVSTVAVPVFARLLRGSMLAQRHSEYVLAARATGVKPAAIVFRHMLPNSLGPVLVQATLTLAISILEAAALSYLGLGDPNPDRAEWGLMLANAQRYFDVSPQLSFYPAIAIIVVALGFTLLGESMREALDPKNRR